MSSSLPCFIPATRGLVLRRALSRPLRATSRPLRSPTPRAPTRACAAHPPPPADDFDADAALRAFDNFLDDGGLDRDAEKMNRKDARRLALDKEDEFRRKAFERRLDVLTALPDDIVVAEVAEKCSGCGCALQSADEGMPGFLPREIREERAEGLLRKEEEAKEAAKEAEAKAAVVPGEESKDAGVTTEETIEERGDFVGEADASTVAAEPEIVAEIVAENVVVEEESGVPGLSAADLAELRGILVEEGIEVEGGGSGSGVGGKKTGKAESVVCQRCFRLNNYGSIEAGLRVESPRKSLERKVLKDVDDAEPGMKRKQVETSTSGKNVLTPATFRENLARLKTKPCVIVYLVDVFDFHGTFISGLRDIIGDRSPVILAVNKVDLLPKDYKVDRVERWVRQESASLGLETIQAVHLVSSRSGAGVKSLLADALALARKRRCDIYVVGAANVGKSSFINNVMSIKMRRAESNASKRADRSRSKVKRKSAKGTGTLTTSVIPGTTLDVIRVPLDRTVSLYDTPGIIMKHQLTNSLSAPELRAVLPARSVERVTLRLGEGKALFLGGLARIEVVEGRPFFFTAFVSSDVKVHPGRVEDADEFTKAHVGELLTPPYEADRLEELGEWTSKEFTAEGDGWQRACVDIVLSGLGWVAVTGAGNVRLRVCTPKGVGIFTRDSLMPFEVKVSGASRYTGTRSINAREENRAERKKKERRRNTDSDFDF